MRFQILFNHKKAWAESLAKEVELFLIEKGLKKDNEKSDISIVIGGDGTFFYYKDSIKGKVICIGSETSYITQLKRHNWKRLLMDYINSSISIDLPLLDVFYRNRKLGSAINDVVIHSKDHKTIKIAASFLDRYIFFEGDGAIIATPMGSSGYSFSSGGSLMHLLTKALILTPIAPIQRSAFPLVFPITEVSIIYTDGNAEVIIDGQKSIKVNEEQKIIIKPSKKTIKYVLV